ncbi:MAG TPA: response regulator transcription factor [Actinomycetota bacterium]|nr:response regulator transcription factor [Actinomycetota bacterium]
MESIRTLIVDDHRMFSEALRLLLEGAEGVEIVGSVQTAEEALDFCGDDSVDVVLMDIDLPGIDGVEATKLIRQAHPHTRVVVITAFTQSDLVAQAVAAGAAGFVPKTHAVEDLLSVIRLTASPGIILAGAGARPIPSLPRLRPGQGQAAAARGNFTVREIRLLQAIADGWSTRDVATALSISPETVRHYTKKILAKLGVHSKAQAIVVAARQGIIELSDQAQR